MAGAFCLFQSGGAGRGRGVTQGSIQTAAADTCIRHPTPTNPKQNKTKQDRPVKKVTVVIMMGDRGLCGGYNAKMIKLAERRIKELKDQVREPFL